MTERLDAPNQQVVRADGSGPAEEGTGGTDPAAGADELDALTKDDLLALGDERGLAVTAAMTKAEIRAVIEAERTA